MDLWINRLVTGALLAFLLSGCAQLGEPGSGKGNTVSALQRIQTRGELVLGTSGNMPPLNMLTRGGEVVGYEVDLARMIADAMGVELRVKTMSFADLLPALEAGRVDLVLSGMAITPGRNLKTAFVGPYLVSGKCLLSTEESLTNAGDVSRIDRPELKLTALKGSTSEAFVKQQIPKARLTPVVDYDEGVKKILSDQVDGMVADYPICVVSLLRHPDSGLVSVLSLLTQEPLGAAIPADTLYINWLDNFLQSADATGRIGGLKQRWFEDNFWLDELP